MANNTLYVTIDGNDAVAAVGDPTRPFTFIGAVTRINSLQPGVIWRLDLAPGTYNLGCNTTLNFRVNVIVTGSGVKKTILNAFALAVDNASVTFQSCSIRTCQSSVLFAMSSGSLNL